MLELLYFALGMIIGLLVNPFRENIKDELQKVKDKLLHKQGFIVGFSEEEENFKNSLNSNFDKKIK